MSTSPIRFGIIGCAEIASKVARAISLSPNATLIAVGSRSIDKARKFISDNALPASTVPLTPYDAVLNHPSVDAVYVPLPTSLHVTWAVAAAKKGKHVLLEKPTALCVEELDVILQACRENRVQFMDSTMLMHHPRTEKMRELITDPTRFGEVKTVDSIFTYSADENFLQNDIRVKPDLDALGALGDVGWYCIRSILWANSYQLPETAVALRGPVKNNAGVLLSCGAQLLWPDGRTATLNCSFLAHLSMQLTVIGTKGLLNVSDFVIPYEEGKTSFAFVTDASELATGWDPVPSKHEVLTDLPQEARMVQEFARLVKLIKEEGKEPETKWPEISRKTQLVIDAVKKSVDNGFEPVEIIG
ncbi:Oxidoreductase family, NAD-binding Rossmann fold [Carex littledalei]|uniref:Oxidoreductase family, NAD-binding Rossmann fold n=1 Tax=Carex littledalei TaxID=544730 RepID=A0A833VSU2_9POAL|nr:Oxidoreductase family, NAD-binding Rossmann fold [Carex littledalei]